LDVIFAFTSIMAPALRKVINANPAIGRLTEKAGLLLQKGKKILRRRLSLAGLQRWHGLRVTEADKP
jgi:hypothetical protein